jgi:hypothetical protein
MPGAQKYEDTFDFGYGTISSKTIVNETKNGTIFNYHISVDYTEFAETLGFVDNKEYYISNQNVFIHVFNPEGGGQPYHFHFNQNDWTMI